MKPNADHRHVVTYTIRQKTTAPDLQKTVQAFEDELKLQYGSTVELVAVTWEDGRPPQTEQLFEHAYDERHREAMLQGARFHWPIEGVPSDLTQDEREALIAAAATVPQLEPGEARGHVRGVPWTTQDLGLDGTGRKGGW